MYFSLAIFQRDLEIILYYEKPMFSDAKVALKTGLK
jgi:hypothetical protein